MTLNPPSCGSQLNLSRPRKDARKIERKYDFAALRSSLDLEIRSGVVRLAFKVNLSLLESCDFYNFESFNLLLGRRNH